MTAPTRKLVVCTPVGAQSTHYEHNKSKWGDLRNYWGAKNLFDECALSIQEWGGGGLDRTRNMFCANVLRDPDATDLLFIDRDIVFHPRAVEIMWRSPFELVGGAYPLKEINWKAVHEAASMGLPPEALPLFASGFCASMNDAAQKGEGLVSLRELGDFLPVDAIGTGFMLIRRSVLEKMRAAHPDISYQTDALFDSGHETLWLFFQCAKDDRGEYLSEDYFFCRRWKQMGGSVHVYCDARLQHWGPHRYESHLSTRLKVVRMHLEAERHAAAKEKRGLVLPGDRDFHDRARAHMKGKPR